MPIFVSRVVAPASFGSERARDSPLPSALFSSSSRKPRRAARVIGECLRGATRFRDDFHDNRRWARGVVGTATRSCVCKSRYGISSYHRACRSRFIAPSPDRLFIDRTRLSTRLISMKNVTISRTPARRDRERDNLRAATKLARVIDRCLPMLS